MLASMLRDMRTRYGATYISYMIAIGWPLTHLTILYSLYVIRRKIAPIGDDPAIFAVTGAVPYIMCLYPARFTCFAILHNRPLLQFPVVSAIQLVFARAILEALSSLCVFLIFVSVLTVFNLATVPSDVYLAACVIATTLYLGISIGIFGIVLVSFQPMVGIMTIVFFIIGMYLTSGAFIPTTMASPAVKAALWYNPLGQAVGLLRSTYYDGYDASQYSIFYIILFGSVFLFFGLIGERLFRGKIIKL
jgi:capsular polysaccharide transport system permease protein